LSRRQGKGTVGIFRSSSACVMQREFVLLDPNEQKPDDEPRSQKDLPCYGAPRWHSPASQQCILDAELSHCIRTSSQVECSCRGLPSRLYCRTTCRSIPLHIADDVQLCYHHAGRSHRFSLGANGKRCRCYLITKILSERFCDLQSSNLLLSCTLCRQLPVFHLSVQMTTANLL
jgi:hypothetical protein